MTAKESCFNALVANMCCAIASLLALLPNIRFGLKCLLLTEYLNILHKETNYKKSFMTLGQPTNNLKIKLILHNTFNLKTMFWN